MPKRDDRRLVSVPIETFKAIQQLQRELAAVTGQRVTIGDVVARGAQCLCDAHAGRHGCLPPNRKNLYGSGFERR